jgi:hypothetical protein
MASLEFVPNVDGGGGELPSLKRPREESEVVSGGSGSSDAQSGTDEKSAKRPRTDALEPSSSPTAAAIDESNTWVIQLIISTTRATANQVMGQKIPAAQRLAAELKEEAAAAADGGNDDEDEEEEDGDEKGDVDEAPYVPKPDAESSSDSGDDSSSSGGGDSNKQGRAELPEDVDMPKSSSSSSGSSSSSSSSSSKEDDEDEEESYDDDDDEEEEEGNKAAALATERVPAVRVIRIRLDTCSAAIRALVEEVLDRVLVVPPNIRLIAATLAVLTKQPNPVSRDLVDPRLTAVSPTELPETTSTIQSYNTLKNTKRAYCTSTYIAPPE